MLPTTSTSNNKPYTIHISLPLHPMQLIKYERCKYICYVESISMYQTSLPFLQTRKTIFLQQRPILHQTLLHHIVGLFFGKSLKWARSFSFFLRITLQMTRLSTHLTRFVWNCNTLIFLPIAIKVLPDSVITITRYPYFLSHQILEQQ